MHELPGYIDVVQTVLVVLTMVELFLDRPCILLMFYWLEPRHVYLPGNLYLIAKEAGKCGLVYAQEEEKMSLMKG